MTALLWDNTRSFSQGIDRCVLYFDRAIVWNGVVSVAEDQQSILNTPVYLDGRKVLDVMDVEDCSLTVTALTYPDIFDDMITKQPHLEFGFSYRTKRDVYDQIHLVYNITAAPSPETDSTLTQSIAPSVFTWSFSTRSVSYPGLRPTAHFVLDSEHIRSDVWAQLEANLYGSSTLDASLPSFEDLVLLNRGMTTMTIVEYPDGTWTATGPASAFAFPAADEFSITWDTITIVNTDMYTISSGD